MDEDKMKNFSGAIRAVYIILTLGVIIGLCLDPLKHRSVSPYPDLIFIVFCVVSIGDLIAVRVIMHFLTSSKFKAYLADAASGNTAQCSPMGTAIAITAISLATLIYPVVFYLMGGSFDKALMLTVFTVIGYIQLLTLLPKCMASFDTESTSQLPVISDQ